MVYLCGTLNSIHGGQIMQVLPPSHEEMDRLRKDAGEGDANAVAFLRNHENALTALNEWRRVQAPSSDK